MGQQAMLELPQAGPPFDVLRLGPKALETSWCSTCTGGNCSQPPKESKGTSKRTDMGSGVFSCNFYSLFGLLVKCHFRLHLPPQNLKSKAVFFDFERRLHSLVAGSSDPIRQTLGRGQDLLNAPRI